jgi:diguanylate cyclase (GGDEF)-like protein
MNRLKNLFAKQADPYAGADLDLTRRLGGLFWGITALLALALWPLSPVDRQIGDAGWVIGGVLIAWGLTFAVAARSPRLELTFEGVLGACYFGAVCIAVLQWFAGGTTAPYDGLLINPLLLVAATNPMRRIAAFLGFVGLALAAPLVYGGWDSDIAARGISSLVIWGGLSMLVFLMMSSIRVQRLTLRRDGEQAREEARLDELTAIGNRRAFEESLLDEVARADRMGVPLSMAMGDIEHFKRINDEFGHLEGDHCLRRVAEAMASELRTPDRVFRWGGDEFALLLPGTDKDGAETLAERLQAKVSVACRRPDDQPLWIHFAAAELRPQMTPTDLVEAADLALMAERAQDQRERQ